MVGHHTSICRQGRSPQAVQRTPGSSAEDGLEWGCRWRGPGTGRFWHQGRSCYHVHRPPRAELHRGPPCSSDEEDRANTEFIPWLRQGCRAVWTVSTKVMHLWVNIGLLETYGDFAIGFTRSKTPFLVFAICIFHFKNWLSVLLAGGNV